MWALGNIAADSLQAREEILKEGIVQNIIKLLDSQNLPISLLEILCWATSSICRGTSFELISPLLKILPRMLEIKNEEIMIDTISAWAYFTEANSINLKTIMQSIPIPKLFEILLANNGINSLRLPILRVLGNIIRGPSELVDNLMKAGILSNLKHVLLEPTIPEDIYIDICWLLSDIAAGPSRHIKALLKEGLTGLLCQVVIKESRTIEVRKAILTCLSNGVLTAVDADLEKMIDQMALEAFTSFLDMKDVEDLELVIKALNRIFSVEKYNEITSRFQDIGGMDKLVGIYSTDNPTLFNRIDKFMKQYYENSMETESEIAKQTVV